MSPVQPTSGELEMPVELDAALAASPAARQVFDALSYSHRREHVMYVAEAKKPETRERRAARTIEVLLH
ncbi:MAG TPA: YdeI/OmpD-associated family protein [Acidimicrobiia bacterium]|nr:YdeI/OmpD-associated family protein [Acidimicrobiia bacterium]